MSVRQKSDDSLDLGRSDTAAHEDFGFDLVSFLRVLRTRRQIIIGTTLAVVALIVTITAQLTPLYTSSAVVIIDTRKNQIEDVSAALSGLPTDQTTVQNQVEILGSRGLANRVVEKLKLYQMEEFNPSKAGWRVVLHSINPLNWLPGHANAQADLTSADQTRAAIIDIVLKHLTVSPVGLSSALTINFESRDPVLAKIICNGFADAYVEDQLDAKYEATQKTTQWLAARIAELSRQSQEADAAVQAYKAANNLTDVSVAGSGSFQSLNSQQTTGIDAQLVIAKSDLAAKEALYNRVTTLAHEGRAASLSEVVSSPLIASLRESETDLTRQEAQMASKYGPRHPKMLDLQSQKANMEAKIAEEVQRVVDSVGNDVVVARARVASLQGSMNGLEAKTTGENQARVKLAGLESAATSARSMYESFMQRLNQMQGQEGITTPDARVISRAEVSNTPSFPRTVLFIAASLPGGIILGLVLAFMAERLDSGFRTTRQVEEILDIPVLATVPEFEGDQAAVMAGVIGKPTSAFSEAVRSIEMGLTLANDVKRPQVLVVTSSVPGEGKTTLAVNFARLSAQAGLKTILIDADFRRPSIAGVFTDTKPEQGIIEVLTGQAELADCLLKDPRSSMVVLPCANPPKNPFELMGKQAMQDLVMTLRKAFDVIVLDSAPVLPVNDTKYLCPIADSVIFVVRWEKTPRDAVVNSIRSLKSVNAKIGGVVLTRANFERFHNYSFGYQDYGDYQNYYSG